MKKSYQRGRHLSRRGEEKGEGKEGVRGKREKDTRLVPDFFSAV